jgi:hypothetical protein
MSLNPVFHGSVDAAGKLSLSTPIKGLLARHLQTLKDKPVTVTVKVYRKQRTDRQSRYYFGVVVPLIAEHCGYDKQEMHELLAMRFLRVADDPVTGSPRRRHTPETDTKDFSDYVDACIRLAAELGVYIPEAGEVS